MDVVIIINLRFVGTECSISRFVIAIYKKRRIYLFTLTLAISITDIILTFLFG